MPVFEEEKKYKTAHRGEKKFLMESVKIVKIGGNVIDKPDFLQEVLKKFVQLDGHKVLVHGGGAIATQLGEQLGIKSQMVNGRRVTDAETLKLVTMVYGGLLNKKIVASLQTYDCNALGLTGADGNLIPAHKREAGEVDYGYVGDFSPSHINNYLLFSLFSAGVVPVLAPLTHDGYGNMLNTNADTIAAGIATALSGQFNTQLIYCFEMKGVMMDIKDPDSVIPEIDVQHYRELKEKGIVAAGMLPKLDNAFNALKDGVESVRICHASELDEPKSGTLLCL